MQSHRILHLSILLLLLLALFQIPRAAASTPQQPLPPLRSALIRANEIEYPGLIPVTLNHGADATSEMTAQCALDCVKWFWGGTSSLMVMMNLSNSEAGAVQTAQNIVTSYKAYGDSFTEHWQGVDSYENNDNFQSWIIRQTGFSADIVQTATHGKVWIWMVLHVQESMADMTCDTPAEYCFRGDLITYQTSMLNLMRLQQRKLALAGYSPIPAQITPLATIPPEPTAANPPAEALNNLDLFSSRPYCSLPCLNGLQPGKSTIKEIPAFFNRLGVTTAEPSEQDGELCKNLTGLPQGIYFKYPPEICVTWKNEIVQKIELSRWNHPELFYLDRMAAALGTPDKIKAFYGHGMRGYDIVLFYPKQFLSIEISGEIQEHTNWLTCLSDRRNQTAHIILYAPGTEADALEFYNRSESPYQSLSGMEDKTTEETFNFLRLPDHCFLYVKNG